MAEQPKSRLDREIDEILEKKSREPIPFQSHSRAKKHRQVEGDREWQRTARRAWHWLQATPIAMAYLLVVLAMIVHDASPLLALLLSAAAVASIWYPGIRRLTRPAVSPTGDVKYWRGRPYRDNIKSAVSRSPVDSLKRYFDRHR